MSNENSKLTHVAGTFLVQADGAFLNGGGIDQQREDKNTSIPKSYRDGIGNRVPYVSAQAWRRWLRNTLIEETGWPASILRAIDLSERGTTKKIAGELNPIEFAEDDIFGYMFARKGQGREEASGIEDEEKSDEELKRDKEVRFFKEITTDIKIIQTGRQGKGKKAKDVSEAERIKIAQNLVKKLQEEFEKRLEEDEEAIEQPIQEKLESIGNILKDGEQTASLPKNLHQELNKIAQALNPGRLKALTRTSPFAGSLLVSVRRKGWEGVDKGYVHLQEGTPLPYNTEFYNTHLQGIFCLNYSRLGLFCNIGDRLELDQEKEEKYLRAGRIRILQDEGKLGKIYEMADAAMKRKERATALFRALAVLRGGAKQAQFGTDVAPKVLILAGLTCGNPIFNHLFKDDPQGPVFQTETFKEVLKDYADRIVTPVLLGIRTGYIKNEEEVRQLEGWYQITNLGSSSLTTLRGPIKMAEQEEKQQGRWIEVKVVTPLDAAKYIGDLLHECD
jgi:CRISPR/Cas system-associated protein Cas7 (RAMP superfamily)